MSGWGRGQQRCQRAVSPVVGAVLLVLVVVLLATAVFGMVGQFQDRLGGPQVETAMEFESADEGLVVRPNYIGQEVVVEVNGYPLHRPDVGDASREFFVPVAPGDRVVVTTEADGRSALLRKRVDQKEAGDFIAFYSFEEPPDGGTVRDRSWNDNHGQVGAWGGGSGPTWVDDAAGGTGLRFDGSDDYVKVDSLAAREDVEAFTVAVRYRIAAPTGNWQQLVEHHHDPSDFEWYLETATGFTGSTYRPKSKIGIESSPDEETITGPTAETGETHVLAMTYDGGTMRYYQDGTLVGTRHPDHTVRTGDLYLGADAPTPEKQYLDGTVYELRLYYEALDPSQVDTLSEVMRAGTAER